jgi:quercetin dioxygenase-like cupin family protein
MPELIESPTLVEAAGEPPKRIAEHVGSVNTRDARVSIARMTSPPGWSEPWQQPEFDEWTVVLAGSVLVEYDGGRFEAGSGQAVHARPGERVRYSTPDGADYIAVCLPAFAPQSVHRDS